MAFCERVPPRPVLSPIHHLYQDRPTTVPTSTSLTSPAWRRSPLSKRKRLNLTPQWRWSCSRRVLTWFGVYRASWSWTGSLCPTVTVSLAHRPDLELLLRIRAEPSRRNGGGRDDRKSWLGCNGVGPLESSGERGGDTFLFYNVTVIMLWFGNCAIYIHRLRKTGITLHFQVSMLLFRPGWKVSVP